MTGPSLPRGVTGNGPTVVLVPGGFIGVWMWSEVVGLLERDGIAAVAVPLTSVGEDGAVLGDLYDDVEALRRSLDQVEPPVLLCGHSYGGTVITEAAAGPHPAVRHLVYLAAAAPDVGESLVSVATAAGALGEANSEDPPAEAVTLRSDGTALLKPESARGGLFNDCADDRADQALDQLLPMNVEVNAQPVRAAAWRELPATYVRCSRDQLPELLSPAFSERVTDVVELPTGHCPHWSQPDLVAELLAKRVRPMAEEGYPRRSHS